MSKNRNLKVPETVINKMAEQEKEIGRLIQVIAQKNMTIEAMDRQYADLRTKYETYIKSYAERVEALAEAEREYKKAVADARSLMASYKAKAEAQIEEMRQFNRSIS